MERAATVSEALEHLDENCLEPHPDMLNVHCNRPPFHHGDHISRVWKGSYGKEVARWPSTMTSPNC